MNFELLVNLGIMSWGIEDGPWRISSTNAGGAPEYLLLAASNPVLDGSKFKWTEYHSDNANFSYLGQHTVWEISRYAGPFPDTALTTAVSFDYSRAKRLVLPRPMGNVPATVSPLNRYHSPGTYWISAVRGGRSPKTWEAYLVVRYDAGVYWETMFADHDLGLPWPRGGAANAEEPKDSPVVWTVGWSSASTDGSAVPKRFEEFIQYATTLA